jgi:hypothetical protein
MDRQLVRVRVIDSDELNTRVHERRNEGEVAGQAIELGNDEPGFLFLAGRERLLKLWPVVALAALNLGELGNQGPPASVQVALDCLALSLEAKTRSALPVGADAEIGDESTLQAAEKRFRRASMSNIDSKTESDTHDRFKKRRVRIRLLLSLTQIPRFSAACLMLIPSPGRSPPKGLKAGQRSSGLPTPAVRCHGVQGRAGQLNMPLSAPPSFSRFNGHAARLTLPRANAASRPPFPPKCHGAPR